MRRLALICLLSVSLWSGAMVSAQSVLPLQGGQCRQYAAYIEMPKGYVSGVCVLQKEDSDIKGCLFNEFGITTLDFTYHPERRKVTLHNVMKMMDKWYIRRVLRKDLAQLMQCLERGETHYQNASRHISYQMKPIEDEVAE